MENLEIIKFTLDTDTDGDDEMRSEVSVRYTNSGPADIRWIKTSASYLDGNRRMIGFGSSDHDVRVRPEASTVLDGGSSFLKATLVGSSPEVISCRVSAECYTREFHKLGEIGVPRSEHVPEVHDAVVKSKLVSQDLRIAATRSSQDENGQVQLSVLMGIQNVSSERIEKLQLDWEVFDEDGSKVHSSHDTLSLNSGTPGIFQDIFFSDTGLLHSSTIRFSLSIFRRVELVHGECGVTLE